MRYLILMVIVFESLIQIANAQSLFEYDRVDFFNSPGPREKVIQAVPQEKPETIIDEWAEPVISSSGKVSIYIPPKEVKDFLDKPDPESAKAYLGWNLKRIKKFIVAQELLAKEARELGPGEDSKAMANSSLLGSNSLTDGDKLEGNNLLYFMLKGCPTCQRETIDIEDIYLNHPEIKIEAFASGFTDRELESFTFPVRQDNGMSQVFKIHSYPAILAVNKKKEKYFLSGYVDKEKILGIYE